ncbi:hypothetical protein C4K28_2382 [Pseudomonas chlororaphis subsp. piscium]|nr:hypothetical protein C4K28_2382 [Pseudomonas chlororaphis subsp. piscium]
MAAYRAVQSSRAYREQASLLQKQQRQDADSDATLAPTVEQQKQSL